MIKIVSSRWFLIKYFAFAFISLFVLFVLTQLFGWGGKEISLMPLPIAMFVYLLFVPLLISPLVILVWLFEKLKIKK